MNTLKHYTDQIKSKKSDDKIKINSVIEFQSPGIDSNSGIVVSEPDDVGILSVLYYIDGCSYTDAIHVDNVRSVIGVCA